MFSSHRINMENRVGMAIETMSQLRKRSQSFSTFTITALSCLRSLVNVTTVPRHQSTYHNVSSAPKIQTLTSTPADSLIFAKSSTSMMSNKSVDFWIPSETRKHMTWRSGCSKIKIWEKLHSKSRNTSSNLLHSSSASSPQPKRWCRRVTKVKSSGNEPCYKHVSNVTSAAHLYSICTGHAHIAAPTHVSTVIVSVPKA